MNTSRTPAARMPSRMCSMTGLPCERSIGFGTSLVSSFIRVPFPAAKMTAFMQPMKHFHRLGKKKFMSLARRTCFGNELLHFLDDFIDHLLLRVVQGRI